MAKKRVNSKKTELLEKSREAMLAAVQIYNNPHITFKSESFITLSVIGWTYLLHAYYKSIKVDYRYCHAKGKRNVYDKTKYGAYKLWQLETCINNSRCPLDKETVNNLKFIIGVRHEIEHQMTNKIDEYLSAKLQACALNYDYYICKLFGDKYNLSNELSLAIQFSPLTKSQQEILKDNSHITSNVRNFIIDFENVLSDDTLSSSHYAYRVLFVPINAKRKGKADQVIEFIDSNSPLAANIEKTYTVLKETEKIKFLPSDIVTLMKKEGYDLFSITRHTELWKSKNAKDPNLGYGVLIAKTWYWYETWVNEVRKHCLSNANRYKSSY